MGEKASKFKVGDVVRVVNALPRQEEFVGKIGTVGVGLQCGTLPYLVDFEDGDDDWFRDENLELVDMEKESILTAVAFLIEQGSKEDLRAWLLEYLRKSAVEIMDDLGDYDRAFEFLKLEQAVRQ